LIWYNFVKICFSIVFKKFLLNTELEEEDYEESDFLDEPPPLPLIPFTIV
jgi:hypothetical protein